jgi:hypothetical protein
LGRLRQEDLIKASQGKVNEALFPKQKGCTRPWVHSPVHLRVRERERERGEGRGGERRGEDRRGESVL